MIALVLFIGGLFLLKISGPVASFLALDKIVQFNGLIGIVVVISAVVLLLQLITQAVNLVQQHIRQFTKMRKAIADLATLSEDEQEVIRFCVERRRRTIPGRDTWDVQGLVEKGLLEVRSGKSLGRQAVPCTIPESVWRYLTKKCIDTQGRVKFPAGTGHLLGPPAAATRQLDPAAVVETLVLGGEDKR